MKTLRFQLNVTDCSGFFESEQRDGRKLSFCQEYLRELFDFPEDTEQLDLVLSPKPMKESYFVRYTGDEVNMLDVLEDGFEDSYWTTPETNWYVHEFYPALVNHKFYVAVEYTP